MHVEVKKFNTKKETYQYLNEQLVLQVKDIKNDVANMANASALIYLLLDDLNWSGFYLMKDGALALGPFQGKPAVVDIAIGAGVCGTCVAEGKTQVVKDVHKCCNHIACDISWPPYRKHMPRTAGSWCWRDPHGSCQRRYPYPSDG